MHYSFYALDTLSMSPQKYQYQFRTDFEDMQKIRITRYYFRHETQSKQGEIHVFKFRIKQIYFTTVFFALDTLSMSPKGISTNSGSILRICKNFEKLGIIFDMEHKRG